MRRALLCLCLLVGCATSKQKEEKKQEQKEKAAVADKAANRLACNGGTAVGFESGEACVAKPLAALIKCLDQGFGEKQVRRASDHFLAHRGVHVGDTAVSTANAQADFVAAYVAHTKPDLDACAIIRSCALSEGVTPVCP